MQKATSKDGTTIAYDQVGAGPVVILVAGALQYRAFDQGLKPLADFLAPQFMVIHYDRRGRGDSTEVKPFAVEREIEDIEALIDQTGKPACLIGLSSGAALAFEAALALGGKVKKLAMYEAPYNDEPTARQAWVKYRKELDELVAQGRDGDAVILCMKLLGMPDEHVEGMRRKSYFSAV